MSGKFKRGRLGTEKFFKKHRNFKQKRNLDRKHDLLERRSRAGTPPIRGIDG